MPRIELRLNGVIHLVQLVPPVLLFARSDTKLGCLRLGHVAEVADFTVVNIGSLPHLIHAIRRDALDQSEAIGVSHHLRRILYGIGLRCWATEQLIRRHHALHWLHLLHWIAGCVSTYWVHVHCHLWIVGVHHLAHRWHWLCHSQVHIVHMRHASSAWTIWCDLR